MDAHEDHWQGCPDRYDVRWFGPTGSGPNIPVEVPAAYRALVETAIDAAGRSQGQRSYERILIPAALPLGEARLLLRTLSPGRLCGELSPVRYRVPRISLEEARRKAQALLDDQRQAAGRAYGPLSQGRDDRLWWTFAAADIEAQQAGKVPGAEFFSIDKWDGRPAPLEAWRQLARFSRGVRAEDHWLGKPDSYDLILLLLQGMDQRPHLPEDMLSASDWRLIAEAIAASDLEVKPVVPGPKQVLIPFGHPLMEARTIQRTLRRVRAWAHLVPSRYRVQPLGREMAYNMALRHILNLRDQGHTLGNPNEGVDGLLWWRFAARRMDIESVRPSASPHASTRIFVSIDGWDGHVVTEREAEDYEYFDDPLP